MCWVDQAGTVVWANRALVELLGCTLEEVVGSQFVRFLADPSRSSELLERLAGGDIVHAHPVALACREGEVRHAVVDAAPFRANGTVVHTGLFIRDVTEQRRMDETLAERARTLQAADRLKDEFLATISHELRTPLNAILGWARLLRGGQIDPRKHDKALATIERNATAQAHLIDELLDLARIANDKLTLDVRAVELGEVVASAVESMRPAADDKGVRLACLVDSEVGPFLGDRSRLGQVLWNLISNAVKFTPQGGEVHVRLTKDGDQAHIVVSDTGQGIAPEFLPFVFDRFRQADSGANRIYGGLGLGLAIARHLVEAHGGEVSVASDGRGSGTTFRVALPLLDMPADVSAASSSRPVSSALDGVRVLVVDDDHDARELVAEALRLCGAEVSVAPDSHSALQLLLRAPPDVLVADIGLPVEDGYAFIEKVRKGGLGLPACALTAYARPEDRERSRAAGYDVHVAKPVDPATLCDAVAQLASARPKR
jgi:PAS domain S-box-containing protein